MKDFLKQLATDESGQDTIEYALIATIVALSTAAVVRSFNVHVGNAVNALGNALTNAVA